MQRETKRDPIAIPWWSSFVFRFVMLNMAVVSVLFVALLWTSDAANRRHVATRFAAILKTIVTNGSPAIDGDSLKTIRNNEDNVGLAFRNAKQVLRRLQETNQLAEDGIYILRPDPTDAELFRFVVMLQKNTFIGDDYRPPANLRALYADALLGRAVQSSVYEDEHGHFISGVAPIFGKDGTVVALLQADIRLAQYLADVEAETRRLLYIGAFVILVLLVFGMNMRRRLTMRIGELMKGTRSIREENFSVRVNLGVRDELGMLGGSLNTALERLQERGEMLKFLPEHTQTMIARVLSGDEQYVGLDEVRNTDVAILETDIRGFTALSERLAPAETIALVNRYIGIQAEKILQYRGSIDKYMGDAVLVVFEGSDAPERALHCARDILAQILSLNVDAEQPVWIGAGLSFGPVVMGNMGCDARMEHTVIGPTVNLAARLCSAAKPRELVVQASMIDNLSETPLSLDLPEGEQREMIQVKGVADPVAIVRFSV